MTAADDDNDTALACMVEILFSITVCFLLLVWPFKGNDKRLIMDNKDSEHGPNLIDLVTLILSHNVNKQQTNKQTKYKQTNKQKHLLANQVPIFQFH